MVWSVAGLALGGRNWRSSLSNSARPAASCCWSRRNDIAAASVAAHPGYTDTSLQRRMEDSLERRVLLVTNRLFGQSPDMGALPVLYAAAAPDVPGGTYIGPGGAGEARGYPAVALASAAARDPALATRLWDVSEELTGVSFPL